MATQKRYNVTPFPPEVTVTFTRILIPWGVKASAKGEFHIPSNLLNQCVYKIIESVLPKSVFTDGIVADLGGYQSPPHLISSIDGEVIHEDGGSEPFSWEARAPFNAFKGLTHIESKIEHRHSNMFPTSLSPQEIAQSLPIKIKEFIVLITYYEPKHSRFFGPSASAAGSLSLRINNNLTVVECSYSAETKEKSLQKLNNQFINLFHLIKDLSANTSQLLQ